MSVFQMGIGLSRNEILEMTHMMLSNFQADGDELEREVEYIRPNMERVTVVISRGRSPLATLPKKEKLKNNVKVLSKQERELVCDDCAICLDVHNKIDTVTTECGHSFGKDCFKQWMKSNGNKTCPSCRNKCKCLTSYKVRAPRKPKVTAVAV
jgi:hypothetical protein